MDSLLLIKTSSMGDVVHALPALTDLARHCPNLAVDWMVEESFASIPALHPHTRRVIPVATRRWRKHPFSANVRGEIGQLKKQLKELRHDLALDLQGLLKSAWLGTLSPAPMAGYRWNCAREPLASLFYQERHFVSTELHAVERNRQLAAQALGYILAGPADYGLNTAASSSSQQVVLLHATSHPSKEWPEENWVELGRWLHGRGIIAELPWGNQREHERAQRLAAQIPQARVLPSLGLNQLAAVLGNALAVVGVDTGLTHLAVALNRPVVAIYCNTDPDATGVYGSHQAVNCGSIGEPPTALEIRQQLTQLCPALAL
jgi:heptosyltransferase-1